MDETKRVPRGKTYVYHAAAALGRRRMAKMTKQEMREHQRRAALARWAKARAEKLASEDPR